MCGISGIFDLNAKSGALSEDIIRGMISILRHRGPDETGLYTDPAIQLGHSRLGILDLAGGTQPMSTPDGNLWIVYNGEVFNYIELKKDLERRGHQFTTQTDTEVILHLYQEQGPACLSSLNGQFAIAIWNRRKKELFLARDRVGICPLYYTVAGGRFMFASEIKALFMNPAVPREIDPSSLQQIFTCWTTIGKRTIFRDIYALQPGHYMTIRQDAGPGDQQPFWHLPCQPAEQHWPGSREDAAEQLRELLEDAVRLRLRADVPVGAYLSGGLDSSIIASVIANRFNNRLKTFSIGFAEKAFDEAGFQAKMVRALNTDHRQTRITNQQVADFFGQVIWHSEIPLLRTGPVPLYMLSKLVRENGFKVVLTGEGADEVFGGYNIYKEAKVRAFWAKQPGSRYRPLLLERLYPYIFDNPSRNRAFLQKFFSVSKKDLDDPLMSHQKRWANTGRSTTFFSDSVRDAVAGYDPRDAIAASLPEGFEQRDIFSRAQWLEMNIFMSNYLLTSQGDRVAMANSVELRLPYLDHRVIDFAARLPAHWKIQGLEEKYMLKKAFRDRLPASITKRAKQPYRAPIGPAFFNGEPAGGNSFIQDIAGEEQLKSAGIFDTKKAANLFQKCLSRPNAAVSESENMAVVGIISTQLLYDQFVKNFPGKQFEPTEPDKVVRYER
ncbi:MAG: asparagine synthase (glutamine-hydrolyzing) [Thermodesulfobacteriota bacterium]|nr:asparagine synthase (glutamine-hydrolyzing) [Thermodesulfobacteriota bacterium]